VQPELPPLPCAERAALIEALLRFLPSASVLHE
jgi:hypothetical protein